MSTKRVTYRFNLTFPSAFTIRQLRDSKQRKVQYITIYKRVEAALAAGLIREVGKFRKKAQKGRMQKVYVLSNVTNVMLEVENAGFTRGEFIANVEPVVVPSETAATPAELASV